jgi:hypothetical protein
MKWFKHDSSSNMDAKLRKVRAKYGMEGYGLYWYCLELIAQTVEKHNLTFELEHDSELISIDTGIHQDVVQEMMQFMVKLGLFEDVGNRVYCIKMATRTDEYTQKLISKAGGVPTVSRQTPDGVGIKSVLIEEKEEKEETPKPAPSKRFKKPTSEQVQKYIKEMGYGVDPIRFINFYESNGWKVGKNKMVSWESAITGWHTRDQENKPNQGQEAVF